MIANLRLTDGGEYPNVKIYGVTRYSLNAVLRWGNGRMCVSKKDIDYILIKEVYDMDTYENLKTYKYPISNFYNGNTRETIELEEALSEMARKFDKVDFTSTGTVKDGYEDNVAEFFVTPNFIDDYEVNYSDKESEVYELKEVVEDFFKEYEPISSFECILHEAEEADDYDVLEITWEYKGQ